jgi:mannitol-1-/sugar-/sorbitol-6-phosphatase
MGLSRLSSPAVQIRCKGVLFDMDGILVSSMGSVERSWAKWGQLHGLGSDLVTRLAHGRRAIETIAMLAPELDAEQELKVIEEIEIADNEGLSVLPGVLDLLAALTPAGAPKPLWTVVTSATERLAHARMAVGGIPVPKKIVTADFVTRGKPHPEPFLAGAALLGVDPKDCVVFEDSASGAAAGREAGCTVVATTFSHPVDSLEAAHYLVTDLAGMKVTILPNNEGLTLDFSPLPR